MKYSGRHTNSNYGKQKHSRNPKPQNMVKRIKTPKGYTPISAYPSVERGKTAVYFESK